MKTSNWLIGLCYLLAAVGATNFLWLQNFSLLGTGSIICVVIAVLSYVYVFTAVCLVELETHCLSGGWLFWLLLSIWGQEVLFFGQGWQLEDSVWSFTQLLISFGVVGSLNMVSLAAAKKN